jgi:signal transduction histidine kinase
MNTTASEAGKRIWVHSQVGIGSTFTFTIPVQRTDQVIE